MMMLRHILLGSCLAGLGLSACQPASPSQTPSLTLRLDSLLTAEHVADRFHGSVVVGNAEGVIYQGQRGLANRTWKVPVAASTRFDIASVNKSFVGALVLLAQQEGKLHVSDRLVDHLSEFAGASRFHPEITLHHLLTHSSGLPDYDGVADSLQKDNFRGLKRLHVTTRGYINSISQLPPVGPPGQQFHYSNFGYHLLCLVLEHVYQQPFDALLQTMICRPLGLAHTFNSTDNEAVHAGVAEGYRWHDADSVWLRNGFIDLTLGRRIFSTAQDLYRWGQALTDDRLLPDSLRGQLFANHLVEIPSPIAYGYGWVPYGLRDAYPMGDLHLSVPYVVHGGATEGYRSMLVIVEQGKYIVALLGNVGDQLDETGLTEKIIKNVMEYENYQQP